MAKKKTASPTPVESIRHKDKRANIPTEELRDFVAEDEKRARRRCSTRATRRSTRNSSGRARTSRTAQDLAVPVVPIYIQEKIHPQAIIEDLLAQPRARAGEPERRSSTLFADFNGGPTTSTRRSTSTSTSRTGRTG